MSISAPSPSRSAKLRRLRLGAMAAAFLAVLGVIAAWVAGGRLVAPAQMPIGLPPKDLPIQALTLNSNSGAKIATWVIDHPDSLGVIVLVHGIRANRDAMLSRARLLYQHGYSIVMIDLQAHGESPGEQICLGHLERHDVQAAVDWARQRAPQKKVAIIGVSLGGASALYASPLSIDALVIESVYSTVTDAVHNRVSHRVGPLHHVLSPLLLCQLKPRIGVTCDQLRPIDHIDDVGCPILILSGDADFHCTVDETRQMFEAAQEPKQLQLFTGAGHVDLLQHDHATWSKAVLSFLDRSFR
jgi:alpha-beta hydrolase superfamily lysophospholipase